MIKKLHMVAKDWGKEEWFANNAEEDYCGKILTILENQATSMHYHADKHETFYVLEGTLAVEWIDTKEGLANRARARLPARQTEVCKGCAAGCKAAWPSRSQQQWFACTGAQ